jgi:hypothetical protein
VEAIMAGTPGPVRSISGSEKGSDDSLVWKGTLIANVPSAISLWAGTPAVENGHSV